MKYRIEKDSLGAIKVPAEALWGAQTQRAVNNFPISGIKMDFPFTKSFVSALGFIKDAAAKSNLRLKLLSNKNSFLYSHEEKKYSVFYKNSQRNKMISLFQGDTENKLKALKIAEELADKSTLPILRKGLRDISPEVVEISALLIIKFK